jgi:hypothetical protein
MISHLVKPLSFVTFLTLSACGGGGGGGDDSGGGSGGGGGGVDPTPGSNGLPFGAVGQTLPDDAVDQAITMRSASFQSGGAPTIENARITVDAGFFQGDTPNLDGTITIFGNSAPITLTNGQGVLASGETVTLTYEPNRTGAYAAAIEASVGSLNDINGEAAYVFGFETDPATIAARSGGTVTYTGDFQSFGSLAGAPNSDTEYAGGMIVGVDFTGTRNATVALDGQIGGTQDVDMSGTMGLVGNGFFGDLNCNTAGCTNNGSEIDATFYGPNADELGGVLAIDITVTGVGTYDGVGTFILPAE